MSILLGNHQINQTYKAKMPMIDTEFFDYIGKEDELAGQRLEQYLTALVQQRAAILTARDGTDNATGAKNGNAASMSAPLHNSSIAKTAAHRNTEHNNMDTERNSTEANITRAVQLSISCKRLIASVKDRLGGNKPQVLLPADLTPQLARNIVRMVEGEQGGIRGCAVVVLLHDGAEKYTLGKIVCDPAYPTVTTLYLRLNRTNLSTDRSISNNSSSDNLAATSTSSSSNSKKTVVISAGYTLEKRRKTRQRKRSANVASLAAREIS